jgi:Gnt-I system low-affinity gluconate transporter
MEQLLSPLHLLIVASTSIVLLLLLVLWLKIHAFPSLLLVSIFCGFASGMPSIEIIQGIQQGMGSTLGYVATIIGLGAIFGQFLEASGGATVLARSLLRIFGEKRASWALMLSGFVIAIPVFFDIGFVILVPLVFSLSKQTGKPIMYYAICLLAGLAVTHAFVPPTPGPVAVADILGADLGWVILFGIIAGSVSAIVAGPVWGKYVGARIQPASNLFLGLDEEPEIVSSRISFRLVLWVIGCPLLLITGATVVGQVMEPSGPVLLVLQFVGHPFLALLIATLLSMYFLGKRAGFTKNQLMDLSGKALYPAGLVILVTGAGGVFKEILVMSGVGPGLAGQVQALGVSPLVMGFLLAAIIRLTQGSATVAMITSAGFLAPVVSMLAIPEIGKALLVISIASGATIGSHVNDSGFWLVGKYLGINEKQTLQSWTMMVTIIGFMGFLTSTLLWWVIL